MGICRPLTRHLSRPLTRPHEDADGELSMSARRGAPSEVILCVCWAAASAPSEGLQPLQLDPLTPLRPVCLHILNGEGMCPISSGAPRAAGADGTCVSGIAGRCRSAIRCNSLDLQWYRMVYNCSPGDSTPHGHFNFFKR